MDQIHKIEECLGTGIKDIQQEEKELYEFAREYIYTNREIKKGEDITKENIIILRSGKSKKGLHPEYYTKLIGKKVTRELKENEALTKEDIENF